MICGSAGGAGFSWPNFPYRSSTYLTEFFRGCNLDFVHDGSTRKYWVIERLDELNRLPAPQPQLPSSQMTAVITELLDRVELKQNGKDPDAALSDVNLTLGRDGLQAFYDGAGRCHVRSIPTQVSSAQTVGGMHWTPEEIRRRARLAQALDSMSEDEVIEDLLQPLFAQLGFARLSLAGHKDKSLEYGNDLWMKYQLPTTHYLYFAAQVKKDKLDSTARSSNSNIAVVLNQINMVLKHPIWDPETNKRVLVDHVFIISAGEITKQAKAWLGQHLDLDSRRQVIFMDRDDILNLAVGMDFAVHKEEEEKEGVQVDDDLPF
jgi:hypothetical protein